jgi:beta-glucosidase
MAKCEHRIDCDGVTTRRKRRIGLSSLAAEYYRRYHLPLFHCETNRESRVAVGWLNNQWNEILTIRASGIPIHGFTWYSLTDQIDWQYGLRIERDDLHPVGLYDMNRRIRPVGRAYRRIISEYAPLMQKDSPVKSINRRRASR